jgi:hypothetical protein
MAADHGVSRTAFEILRYVSRIRRAQVAVGRRLWPARAAQRHLAVKWRLRRPRRLKPTPTGLAATADLNGTRRSASMSLAQFECFMNKLDDAWRVLLADDDGKVQLR